MARGLTAYEILEIAEKMERNAAEFYRRAAGLCHDPKVSKLFHELAQWERHHIQIFVEMKEQLSEKSWQLGYYQPGRSRSPRPQVPAPPVFSDQADPARELTGHENKIDVLVLAIQKEEYVIAYYTSLREFVLGRNSVEVLKDIIHEENRHLKILTQSLEQIGRRRPGEL